MLKNISLAHSPAKQQSSKAAKLQSSKAAKLQSCKAAKQAAFEVSTKEIQTDSLLDIQHLQVNKGIQTDPILTSTSPFKYYNNNPISNLAENIKGKINLNKI